MNPFQQKAPLPAGSRGERGFKTAEDAKAHARNQGAKEFAVLEARKEYAWIAPCEAFAVRALPAITAGINLVEFVR